MLVRAVLLLTMTLSEWGLSSEIIPPGSRLYVVDERGVVSIVQDSGVRPPAAAAKVYRDPIFDQKKFEVLQAAEREALIKRSKIVDKDSLISFKPSKIRGRIANPRVQFNRETLKIRAVNRAVEHDPLLPLRPLSPLETEW